VTQLPLTRNPAPPAKAEAIRAAVRATEFNADGRRRIANAEDAQAFFDLIADPRVSDPIYTLPKPPSLDAARTFINRHVTDKVCGEGLLIFDFDETGALAGYHDIQVWPEWAACELGGAIRPDRQGGGTGSAGAAAAFDWLFDVIGVDLICETAALDNIRTRKLLDRLGFRCIGEIESRLPGGGVRPSQYFEMTREEWAARQRSTID
jgi:RimJ/RimL family protein N-acetyltransferase